MPTWKLGLIGSISFAVAVIGASLVWRLTESKTVIPQVLSVQDPPVVAEPLPESVTDLDSVNLLLLGMGGAGHQGGQLTDAIVVVHVDFNTGKVALVSIPRDVQVEGQKINGLYANSVANLKQAVAVVTGFPVNYYVAVDFVGFQRAMGYVLDGVEVEIAADFDDPWYPTEGKQLDPCGYTPEEIAELTAKYSDFELQKHFACRYERVHFDQGKVYMNGAEALKYVRSRHTSSDFDRGRRQQEVVVAVKNKLLALNALDDVAKFFTDLVQYVQTDLDVEIVKYLAPALKRAGDFGVVSISLEPELKSGRDGGGAFILVPKNNFETIRQSIEQQLR